MPEYEEHATPDLKQFDYRALEYFESESKQDYKKAISEMNTQHINYSGHLQKGRKEGKGAFICPVTDNFYYG